MGITDPFQAYQFNRIVEAFGYRVDSYLQETKKVKKGKGYELKPKYSFKQAIRKAARPENSQSGGGNPYMLADLQRLDNAGSGFIDD